MRRAGRAFVFILVLLVVGFIGFYYLTKPINVSEDKFQPSEISGVIETDETDVNVKTPGRVARVMVEEGDEVKEGEIIAQLEAENVVAKVNQAKALVEITNSKYEQAKIAYKAQKDQSDTTIAQAKAVLEAAKAQSDKAKNGARPQQIEQAKEMSEQAKRGYELAKSTYDRLEKLFKEGVLAEQKLDQAKTELDVAKARYNAAEQQYDLVKEGAQKEDIRATEAVVAQAEAAVNMAKVTKMQVDVREQDIEAAKSQQIQAKAALDEALSFLKDATIKSPVSGIVTMKGAEKGELVSTGMPVITVSNLNNVWANIKVRETLLSNFQIGQIVQVKIPGVPGKIYQGKVTNISAKASYATERASQEKGEKDVVSFGVKIKLNNEGLKLRPGMTAVIAVAEKGKGTFVPYKE